jgi:hypothetical protein
MLYVRYDLEGLFRYLELFCLLLFISFGDLNRVRSYILFISCDIVVSSCSYFILVYMASDLLV